MIPEEQRGVTEHYFTSWEDAARYLKQMEDECTAYQFKMSYKTMHMGNNVWKVTLWVKDD